MLAFGRSHRTPANPSGSSVSPATRKPADTRKDGIFRFYISSYGKETYLRQNPFIPSKGYFHLSVYPKVSVFDCLSVETRRVVRERHLRLNACKSRQRECHRNVQWRSKAQGDAHEPIALARFDGETGAFCDFRGSGGQGVFPQGMAVQHFETPPGLTGPEGF